MLMRLLIEPWKHSNVSSHLVQTMPTDLLALLYNTVPQVFSTLGEVFEGVPYDFLN